MIIIKSPKELELMRRAGRLVAGALEMLEPHIRPGMTTGELDRLVEEYIVKNGGLPAFKGYRGFPASICASVNEVVVHGIPDGRMLVEGDIIGVDIGVFLDGYYGDATRTFPVGTISAEAERLLRVTEEALHRGIAKAVAGGRLGDISQAIQEHVEAAGFSVVREFVGHGLGRQMHEKPEVPNFGRAGQGVRLRAGMTLAIEPMVNAGGPEVMVLDDNWTVVTRDASRSAHFEHTVAITADGPEILTKLD